jgi:hypothetical protein
LRDMSSSLTGMIGCISNTHLCSESGRRLGVQCSLSEAIVISRYLNRSVETCVL